MRQIIFNICLFLLILKGGFFYFEFASNECNIYEKNYNNFQISLQNNEEKQKKDKIEFDSDLKKWQDISEYVYVATNGNVWHAAYHFKDRTKKLRLGEVLLKYPKYESPCAVCASPLVDSNYLKRKPVYKKSFASSIEPQKPWFFLRWYKFFLVCIGVVLVRWFIDFYGLFKEYI